MIWFLYVSSMLVGTLFMGGSLLLAFKTSKDHHSRKAKGDGEFEVEFKWFKVKSSYPMLGLALVGALLVMYPLYDYSSRGQQPVAVEGKIVIVPSSDINDAVVRVMFGPWDLRADSDGMLNSLVHPDVKRFRIEVQAPGRPTLVKTVTISETGKADIGEIEVSPPVVIGTPKTVEWIDTAGLPGLDSAGGLGSP